MTDFVSRIVRVLSKPVSGISTHARALGKVRDMNPIPDAAAVRGRVITAMDAAGMCSLPAVRMPLCIRDELCDKGTEGGSVCRAQTNP